MALVRRFAEGTPVFGVAVIGDHIYIIRESSPHIEVYNKNTFLHERNINIPGMQGPYDMVQSCGHPTFLLIADWKYPNRITAVQLPDEFISSWNITEEHQQINTLGLSRSSVLTGANILVTTSMSQKLMEFTPQEGNLVRQVNLQNIPNLRQSIQVTENEYAFCCGYGAPPALHQVCLVDAGGQILVRYGEIRGPGIGQLNIPGRLERTGDSGILVADTGNRRVVKLSQNLQYIEDLITTNLEGPYRLYFDEENNLLYVADNTVNDEGVAIHGQVIVFQLN